MSQYTPAPVSNTRNSTMAIVSLIAGIAGLTLFPFLGSIVGVITGHIAKSEIKKNAGMVTGNGFATWGLITGYVGIAIGLCVCLIFLLSFFGLFTLPFLTMPTYSS
jgi:hypothetical protein